MAIGTMEGLPRRKAGSLPFLIPSLAQFLFTMIILQLSFSAGALLGDGDTGYHIRAGEYILETLSVPRHDIFSFSDRPIPWTSHEWLSEVVMALVHRYSGTTGIAIFFMIAIAAAYSLLFSTMRKRGTIVAIDILVILLAMVASQLHWLARPHVFSIILAVVWYRLLDAFQYDGKIAPQYMFPPIMLLWVNLHGGYLIGFVLLGIYIAGNLVDYLFDGETPKEVSIGKLRSLVLVFLACLLASCINPHGPRILYFPFQLSLDITIMNSVVEFLSPNFHQSTFVPFEIFLLLLLATLAVSRERLGIIRVALLLVFVHLALFSARHVVLFAVIASPILSQSLSGILERSTGRLAEHIKRKSRGIAAVDASARGYVWPALALLLVITAAAAGKIQYRFDEKTKPVAAADFLKKEFSGGNVFCSDEFGDYLIYTAYPRYKVFIDGRIDMYGTERLNEYRAVMSYKPGWDETIRKSGADFIFIPADSVLSRLLSEGRSGWRRVFADNVASVFVKDGAAIRGRR